MIGKSIYVFGKLTFINTGILIDSYHYTNHKLAKFNSVTHSTRFPFKKIEFDYEIINSKKFASSTKIVDKILCKKLQFTHFPFSFE